MLQTLSQRIRQTKLIDANVGTIEYIYNAFGELESQTDMYEVHYIAGGDGLSAINVRYHNMDKMYFVYTDHLGSILKLTDESGTVVYEQNFDTWGRAPNPNDWTYTSNTKVKRLE